MEESRPKPSGLSHEYAAQFQDASVVRAYHHRAPYPEQTFKVLRELAGAAKPAVLDLGCGTGDVTLGLADFAGRIDAVDISSRMIAEAKRRLGSQNVRWIVGAAESAPLTGPYDLVTAGESLHWLDWELVFGKLKSVLRAGRFLAILGRSYAQTPWWTEDFQAIINHYSTNRDYKKYDLVAELVGRGYLEVSGQLTTAPTSFRQNVQDLVEAFHSRNGFSRDRMTAKDAERFDDAAVGYLSKFAEDNVLNLGAVGPVTWGIVAPEHGDMLTE